MDGVQAVCGLKFLEAPDSSGVFILFEDLLLTRSPEKPRSEVGRSATKGDDWQCLHAEQRHIEEIIRPKTINFECVTIFINPSGFSLQRSAEKNISTVGIINAPQNSRAVRYRTGITLLRALPDSREATVSSTAQKQSGIVPQPKAAGGLVRYLYFGTPQPAQ